MIYYKIAGKIPARERLPAKYIKIKYFRFAKSLGLVQFEISNLGYNYEIGDSK